LNFSFSFRFVDENCRIFVVVVVFVTKINLFSSLKIFVFVVVDEKTQHTIRTYGGGIAAFFLFVDTCLSCEDIARQSCTMVRRWRLFVDFLHPAFPASHMQHVSDMHPKFALRPHHLWKYGRHPISDR